MPDDTTEDAAQSAVDEAFENLAENTPEDFGVLSAETEADSDYDGPVSYIGEVRALILGVLVGLTGSMSLVGLFISYVLGANNSIDSVLASMRSKGVYQALRNREVLQDATNEPAHAIAGTTVGHAALWAYSNGWISFEYVPWEVVG